MSIEVVQKTKQDLINAGVNIDGPCGAFAITNLTAERLNLGILYKPRPTENNCIVNGVGYAADIVMSRSGRIWDILYDGGGLNTPVFNEGAAVNPDWYRDPLKNYPKSLSSTPEVPPVIAPDETLEWLMRTMHVKLDNMHNETLTKIDAVQEALIAIRTNQHRALVGKLFNITVKLVPEIK